MDEWMQRAADELDPAIRGSALMLTLWSGKIDPKLALETGYAVLLDKPFVVVTRDASSLPDNLRRLARQVIEADPASQEGRDHITEALKEIVE